ncbi:MAG: hypothetical protein IPM53_14165 [Anaerolineaceae bacterium]|nr:hypothetical protein [Anaerolineaceae bacterium]
MNEIEKYLHELKIELRDLPEAMQSDVLAEVQTHIEDGLEDEALVEATAVPHTTLLRELGSPAELVRNLHWRNWKRNGRDAALALIPLLLWNPLSLAITAYLSATSLATVLDYALWFIGCLAMVIIAQRLHARLLTGWWLSNTLGAIFSAFFHSVSWPFLWLPGPNWPLLLLALVIVTGGFYGRFLWKNRYDGLTISITLMPFMWGAISIFSIRPLALISGYEWRHMWSGALVSVAWFLIVLTTFVFPGRLRRWLLLFAWYAICTFGSVAIWLPNPNAGMWFLLALPFLLGLGIELAANRHYRHNRLTTTA